MAKYKFIKSPQKIRNYPKYVTHNRNKFMQILLKWSGSIRKRFSLLTGAYVIYNNGGWHFTYMKSPEKISDKISDFSHTEFDTNEFTSIDLVKKRMNQLSDPFDRDFRFEIVDIDDSYPRYIIENQNKYFNIIYKA